MPRVYTESASAHQLRQHVLAAAQHYSPRLAESVESLPAIEPPSVAEGDRGTFLARSVVGQQLSVHAARPIWQRVLELAEDRNMRGLELCDGDGVVGALRACGVSPNKARALVEISKAEQSGVFNPTCLNSCVHSERAEALSAIWGIGPWACDMASIFFWDDLNVWPEGDSAANKVIDQHLTRGKKGVSTKRALIEACGPYRSMLALYSWEIADTGLL